MQPIEILTMIKNGQNPEQIVMNILEDKAMANPMGANLLTLAKDHKTKELEHIARNYFSSQGRDFDKEFKAFKEMLGYK